MERIKGELELFISIMIKLIYTSLRVCMMSKVNTEMLWMFKELLGEGLPIWIF